MNGKMRRKVFLLVLVLAGVAFAGVIYTQFNAPTVSDEFSRPSEVGRGTEGPPAVVVANASVNYTNYIKDEHNNVWEWQEEGFWRQMNTQEIKEKGINISKIQREFPKRYGNKDTDGDWISDTVEIEIGTDSTKIDTDSDGIDDFNEYYTYPHLLDPNNPTDAEKFLAMIPNVEAKIWDSVTVGVYDSNSVFEKEVEIAKRDPLVQWYAKHTEIKSEPETLTEEYRWSGKLVIDGEPFCFGKHKEGVEGINGDISPSYFFTHGRRGACAHMSIATRTVFELKGYQGVFIGVPGHIATEISKNGQNFVINGVGIMKSEDFYETHPQNWTKYPK